MGKKRQRVLGGLGRLVLRSGTIPEERMAVDQTGASSPPPLTDDHCKLRFSLPGADLVCAGEELRYFHPEASIDEEHTRSLWNDNIVLLP